jgi:hypothetical protein
MTDDAVSFLGKDYRQQGRRKVMTLDAGEFMRRFLLHVLPPRLPSHPPLRLPRQWPSRSPARALPPTCWPNPSQIGRASATPSPTTTGVLRLVSISRSPMSAVAAAA